MRHFFYDKDKIIAEREGNSWVVRHLLGLMPVGFEVEGSVRIYYSDRLGGVRYATDASQNTMVSYVMKGLAWW